MNDRRMRTTRRRPLLDSFCLAFVLLTSSLTASAAEPARDATLIPRENARPGASD